MEMEDIYANVEHNNCNRPVKEDLDEDKDIYVNKDTFGSQKQSCSQNESKAQIQGGSRCFVVSTVCLGLICVLLVITIIVQQMKITSDREIKLNYKNMAEEFNQTVNRMQVNYSDLTIEKVQLQSSFNSLDQKKLELETRVNSLTIEKEQLQSSFNSLDQKKLAVEAELMKKNSQRGYYFVNEHKSWSDSRKFCRDRGGDLIIINTEEKQRFISSIIKERVWIGLSDIENEGNMKWVDNSPLKKGFWIVNEPNDADRAEDCVEINPSLPAENNWNDLPCSASKRWICEN
ncbi:C-type lectin domain family 4 member E-like [Xyrauchen texanus]|uniref:C-type lectin domain family 4 member E-like n=1 Tax=Xyrauchen texanus TaxID=154827 RepID=UPI0022419EDF|nr:C-type lectin domain family 4 member E-like [Xyrauchen texanus]